MSKHTPGPWSASGMSSVVGAIIQADANVVGVVYSMLDMSEAEANARLIAAAPDLLEALREMVTAHGLADMHPVGACTNCARARAAMAKATGGEP